MTRILSEKIRQAVVVTGDALETDFVPEHIELFNADGSPFVGGGGGAGGDDVDTYIHTQLAPSSAWDIFHGLGFYPAVTVVDSGGTVLIPDMRYLNINELLLSFGAPTSGKAYLS